MFPLQESKHDTFAGSSSPAFPLPFSPKVGLIQLDLPFEFAALQLRQMVQGFSQALVHPGNHFDIDLQIPTQSVRRLKQVEALEDGNLPTEPTQAFTLATQLTFRIPPTGVDDLKRPAENTLAPPQKVSRTTKNRVSSSNHAPFLAHIGYETP
jgi:hypothetical protein